MSHRVQFRLNMTSIPTWNESWSGEKKNLTIVRTLTSEKLKSLGITEDSLSSWTYSWSDGWRARVDATILPKGKRAAKSDGFCGYDWMVQSIITKGLITYL